MSSLILEDCGKGVWWALEQEQEQEPSCNSNLVGPVHGIGDDSWRLLRVGLQFGINIFDGFKAFVVVFILIPLFGFK